MATWSKLFSNFAWKNRPDTSTPLGQTLLNRLNNAINGIDDRVVTLNAEKVSVDEMQAFFTDVRLIKNTGQFVFTLYDGTEKIIDTALEKISINVSFDQASQMMVLEKEDGSKEYVDLSAFTTQYEFASSPTIQQTVTDGKVTANIKPNSITDQMLQTNYLSDITTQANTAVSASQSALESQSLAEQHAEDAEASADRAEAAADRAEAVVGFTIDTELSTESTNPIANKAVAEEFGKYLPKSGGTINGFIVNRVSGANGVFTKLANGVRDVYQSIESDGLYQLYDGTNSKQIIRSALDGTTAFNGTASGNLPLTGGDVTGKVNFKSSYATQVAIDRLTSGSTPWLAFLSNGTQNGQIGVDADGDLVFMIKADGTAREVLHTGNKPGGNYIGNGDATERTINTGGIGSAMILVSDYSMCIVGSKGAIVMNKSNGTVSGIVSGVSFISGILNVYTTNENLNASGVTYYYQVL